MTVTVAGVSDPRTTLRTVDAPCVEPSNRWLCPALVMLAVGVGSTALLGPLTNGVVHYHPSFNALNQVRGGDLVAVALVSPVRLFAAVLAWRRHPAAPVVALGPAVFAVYTYTQLALTP